MYTPKENFLRLMRNDNPKWFGDPWSCFNGSFLGPLIMDAITMVNGTPKPGEVGKVDIWGVSNDWPLDQPGFVPNVTNENKALKDIHAWRDVINFDNLPPVLPWHLGKEMIDKADPDKLTMVPSFCGMFEFAHNLMGFEDALCNFMLEQNEMYDLLSAYTDWKIKTMEMIIDELHPDIIHSHDDWGDKRRLFMDPSLWREMIKPHFARLYGYIKSRGVLVQHHNDGVSDDVCEDMVDIGIDMWQGVLPQNDIPAVIERTEGKLFLLGGIDMQKIDFPDSKEEDIRAHAREVIDTYAHLGSFIPCPTNITPIYKHVEEILNDELNKYGKEFADKHF